MTVEMGRVKLGSLGAFPRGAIDPGLDLSLPGWSLVHAGGRSPEFLQEEISDLFVSVGMRRYRPSEDREEPTGKTLGPSYWFPLRGLDGVHATDGYVSMSTSFSSSDGRYRNETTGFKFSHALRIMSANYWLAPVGPGCLHDNRSWAAVNRGGLRDLFVGLREIGFSWLGPPDTYFALSPVDGLGFADVDFEWMVSEADDRWRRLVSGELSRRDAHDVMGEFRPAVPAGEPFDWSELGFNRSQEHLHALFDGMSGSELFVDRVQPIYKALNEPEVLGSEDELLSVGARLRDQLAEAVSDSSLASELRSMPVMLAAEELRSYGVFAGGVAKIADQLLGGRKAHDRQELWLETQNQVKQLTRDDALASCHVLAPLRGLDFDLSAAVDLWAMSGDAALTDQGLAIGVSRRYWI